MVIFLVVLVTFGTILELLSLKINLSNIHYHCIPSKLGCEPGEVFEIMTTVSNYGFRTIPFLKLEEEFPKDIVILDKENALGNQNYCLYTSMLYIRGRQRITRTIRASLPNRGLYFLEGSRLFSGDFLGLRENFKEVKNRKELIVFPKLLNDNTILQALSGYYGDFTARRYYIEDPLLVTSYRDYTGREPMRSISWLQSAKKNRLMVKEFDYTTDMSVTILLDVYLHWSEGTHRSLLEYCFSLVRTIAEFLEQKKVSYRLLTNAYIRSENTDIEGLDRAGQGSHHFTMLLYTLGQADSNTFCDIEGIYNIAIKKYSGENAIFYIAPFENEKRSGLVNNLKNQLRCQVYPMYASAIQEVE
ncbi:MAG: hypothetical protein K0R92_613 [Lachnospiraceae bacterium]|jgi:hypothetical protein|nr:hypothetical protein [Lachnospiraceae bacterium]